MGRGRNARDADDIVRRIEMSPPIDLSGDVLRVGRLRGRGSLDSVSISYEIEVPPDTLVRSQTEFGRQDISGIASRVEARTGSGRITLRDLRGTVDVSTGSGRIVGEDIEGSLTGKTGSGRIELTDLAGALHVETSSGRIEAQGEPTGRWDLETRVGSITVSLPDDAGFILDAHAGSGRIENQHPIRLTGRNERNHLAGVARGGGAELRVRTGTGRITIQ